jgi:hypothetical protein
MTYVLVMSMLDAKGLSFSPSFNCSIYLVNPLALSNFALPKF